MPNNNLDYILSMKNLFIHKHDKILNVLNKLIKKYNSTKFKK